MRCPRCDHELDGTPAKCEQCNGCWVTAADVPRTVKSTVAPKPAGASKLACPKCHAQMQAVTLYDVQLDRCAAHGVWFDIEEITDVLRKTGKLPEGGLAKQDKPSIGEQIGDGVKGVGSVILEVVGTAIDIVT